MDGEEFFDRLYAHYHVNFPCFAVIQGDGQGFATRPAPDGTFALVVLTDDDLAAHYLADQGGPKDFTLKLHVPADLSKLIDRLPPTVTHVTFDPSAWFHRRYPVGVIRSVLATAAKAV